MRNIAVGLIVVGTILTTASTMTAQGQQVMMMPRTADGHPDLSGIWQVLNTAAWDIQDHSAEKGVPAGQGVVVGNVIPYQPWAVAKKRENHERRATADPEARCFLPGVPRLTYESFPFQIVQTSTLVSLLYEYVHGSRLVYTDGTKHPSGHIDFWMGDSRGHWEGDTLVVDVIDFNEDTWFDRAGNFHSDAMHLTERYTPMDSDHLDYAVTVEDPKVFTQPWQMDMTLYRRRDKNVQLLEYECNAFDDIVHLAPTTR
jgi:hypothetical protein